MNKGILHTIINYLNDKLSNKERHLIEKEVNTDPFLQDAMDGFEQLSSEEFEYDLNLLNKRLTKHTAPPKRLFQIYKIAAALIILIGIGSLTVYLVSTTTFNEQLAKETQIEPQQKTNKAPVEVYKLKQSDEVETYELDTITCEKEAISPKENKREKELTPERTRTIEPVDKIAPEQAAEAVTFDDSEMEYETKQMASGIEITTTNAEQYQPAPTIARNQTMAGISKSGIKPDAAFTIGGTILDENNEPVIGANIISNDSGNGTITDYDGNFRLEVNSKETIQIAYIGYTTKQVQVENSNDQLEVQLQPDLLALEEVVVIGDGTQKKSDVTGSVSRIESSDISGIPSTEDQVPIVYKARAIKIKYDPGFDEQAYPEIGLKAYKKYIKRNFELTYDSPTKVIATFEVSISDEIQSIDIIEAPNQDFKNETLRLIQNGSSWIPASLNGNAINQKVTLIIKF